MFKVLCEYAKTFGEDFPISKVADETAHDVLAIARACLDANKTYSALTAASTTTTTTSTSSSGTTTSTTSTTTK